jgi:subtilisin-like proprotein convertase family protein
VLDLFVLGPLGIGGRLLGAGLRPDLAAPPGEFAVLEDQSAAGDAGNSGDTPRPAGVSPLSQPLSGGSGDAASGQAGLSAGGVAVTSPAASADPGADPGLFGSDLSDNPDDPAAGLMTRWAPPTAQGFLTGGTAQPPGVVQTLTPGQPLPGSPSGLAGQLPPPDPGAAGGGAAAAPDGMGLGMPPNAGGQDGGGTPAVVDPGLTSVPVTASGVIQGLPLSPGNLPPGQLGNFPPDLLGNPDPTPGSQPPAASGGTLQMAGPGTDVGSPYQQLTPGNGATYSGEFVVQLAPGVSSQDLAAQYGAVHETAYAQLANVNLWKFPATSNPALSGPYGLGLSGPDGLAAALRSDSRVLDAYPVYLPPVTTRGLPNDPLLPTQWDIYNTGQSGGTPGLDGNVQAAWDMGVTGRGVTIGINDTGMDTTHPDLANNINPLASYNFIDNNDDPSAAPGENHATAVAGIAAAQANNGIGGAGVAPDARIGAIRGGTIDTADRALAWNTTILNQGTTLFDGSQIDIYNNSWGPADNGQLAALPDSTRAVLANGVANGRGGLGSVYVWAAGNGRAASDNVNYDGYANSRYAIAVGAVGDNGVVAPYSEPGAALLISAPSQGADGQGVTTTDRLGTNGYSQTDYFSNTGSASGFDGTSAAAPYVSGVVALMLQANPNLSWRDVQHILIDSATTQGLPDSGFGWATDRWTENGAGHRINQDYGFGLVNASGAVNLASNWQPVGPELVADSGVQVVNLAVPDNTGTPAEATFTMVPNIRVEHVEVIFNATHANRGQLQVVLTAPSGTQSVLAQTRTDDANANYNNWRFDTVRNWDEGSAGTWKIDVSDNASGTAGTFNSYQLLVYGTEMTPVTSGPRVTGITDVNGVVNGGSVGSFQVQFNKPVAPSSFTASDINFQRVGSGSPIAITGISSTAPLLSRTQPIEAINFDQDGANNGFLHIPPDPNGAAGPNQLVSVVNTSIQWYTKTGTLQNNQRLGKNGTTATGSFFASLNPVNGTFDPKVVYDQYNGRFVVVSLEMTNNTSRILLAVSQTSDPNQGWFFTAINSSLTISGAACWADYPGFAVDANAIYVSANMFPFAGGSGRGSRLWIINKTPFYTGGAATVNMYDPSVSAGLPFEAFTLQPAQMYGTAPGSTGTFLLSSRWTSGSDNELSVIRVDNPTTTPTFTNTFLDFGQIDNVGAFPTTAPQLGTTTGIDTVDDRLMNAVWRDNTLWAAGAVIPPSGPDINQVTAHWYKIDTTNLSSLAVADEGNVGGEDIATGTYTFDPSINVDSGGDMAMNFAASGPNIHPGAYYTGRLASDPAGTTRAAGVLAAGLDSYVRTFGSGRNRWGDYSSIALDPTDNSRFWLFNEYAMTRGSPTGSPPEDGRWATRWGSISFAPTTFTVSFAAQTTPGNYRVDIGPNINDFAGNPMNQNGNPVNGEATADKDTEFFTLANQFIFSTAGPTAIPDAGSVNVTIPNVPAFPSTGDLNVALNISHDFADRDIEVDLTNPNGTSGKVAQDATPSGAAVPGNGLLNTVLDDQAATQFGVGVNGSYTGNYQPNNTPLSTFLAGGSAAGTWSLQIKDLNAGTTGTFNNASLIFTPANVFDIHLDSVTNLDGNLGNVEVSYTITGTNATPFDLGIFNSTDPFFNINGDMQTGTFTVSNAADLTAGSHTVELNANLFPDPSFALNQHFYSLVVVDPQRTTADYNRFDNYGILQGVTQTPSGALYISGDPFNPNTITITNSSVTFNGTTISYTPSAINYMVLTGGMRADHIDAGGVTKNILAFLGAGNDYYNGGEATDAVQGEAGDDTILGNGGDDRLYGGIGTDDVEGGPGNDTVSTGEGSVAQGVTLRSETLSGGTGNDLLLVEGTPFNDDIMVWDPDNNLAAIGPTLEVQVTNPVNPGPAPTPATVQRITISGVEPGDTLVVNGSYGDDRIRLQNPLVANSTVRLNSILIGGPGNDSIFDGLGVDRLFGDSGYTKQPGDGVNDLHSIDGTPGDVLVGNQGDTFQADPGDTIIHTT